MCRTTILNPPINISKNHSKSLIINDLEIVFYKSIAEIFKQLPPQYNTFLSSSFFKTLEENPPLGFQFRYLLFYRNKQIVGYIACQIKDFRAAESLNFDPNQNPFILKVKKSIASKVNFKTLIIGNLLLTGEHSYYIDNQLVTPKEKEDLILNGISLAKKVLAEEGLFIESVFIKDFFDKQNFLVTEGYNEFQVEPNFIFKIQDNWCSFNDYMNALSSKYRIRVKRAFKKIAEIEKKEFDEAKIKSNLLNINELYQKTYTRSGFNLVQLHAQYFLEMKRNLGDKFRLYGYFLEGQLIGFYTTVHNHEHLDAHYLGYNDAYNHEYQLYLNMLLDMVQQGIEGRFKQIVFARTAHEIKSSLGAEAHDMYLYIKHYKQSINCLMPYLLNILSPREKWQPRQPFK